MGWGIIDLGLSRAVIPCYGGTSCFSIFSEGTDTINPTIEFRPGLYRHYKGNDYVAYGIALHSETEEPLVVYTPLKSKAGANKYPSGDLWVRPLSMFNETVVTGQVSVPRFEFVSKLDADSKEMGGHHDGFPIGRRILRFFSRTSS